MPIPAEFGPSHPSEVEPAFVRAPLISTLAQASPEMAPRTGTKVGTAAARFNTNRLCHMSPRRGAGRGPSSEALS